VKAKARNSSVSKFLAGGDLRSIGKSDEAARLVLRDTSLFDPLIAEMWNSDLRVSMRAADAVEKATRKAPELLGTYKKKLLALAQATVQKEIQWHLAQILPRLPLTGLQRRSAIRVLGRYLQSPSVIVKTCALEALFDLSATSPSLRREMIRLLTITSNTGTPAERARARKLLLSLERKTVTTK
jgi:hypothetical protein